MKSQQAIVLPVCGLGLKIAVVPVATPFLLSNTFMRAVNAMVDTSQNQPTLSKHQATVPGWFELVSQQELTVVWPRLLPKRVAAPTKFR